MSMWPFSLTPQGIGLKGKDREKAQAYYELEGLALDQELLKIEYDNYHSAEALTANNKIELKYNIISEHDYDLENIRIKYLDDPDTKKEQADIIRVNLKHELITEEEADYKWLDLNDKDTQEFRDQKLELDVKYDKLSEKEKDYAELRLNYKEGSKEYTLKSLGLDKKYSEITDLEFEKQTATINEDYWVGFRDCGVEENEGRTGFWFDLDWNDHFITKLREEGYEGETDQLIVKLWYAEICRAVALEEGLETDVLDTLDTLDTEEEESLIKKEDLGGNKSLYR